MYLHEYEEKYESPKGLCNSQVGENRWFGQTRFGQVVTGDVLWILGSDI